MRQRDFFTEYTLMSLAAIGAFYIGEYPEGVAVMLFYSIGEALQERAVERARRNIRALVDIRPEQANVLEDGKPVAMPAAQVVPGRTIEVLPGGRVPLDGVLLSEAAPFNTAALTGESTPRTICKGDEVLAGMISSQHPVRIEVTRPYGESALSRILSMVEEAAAHKDKRPPEIPGPGTTIRRTNRRSLRAGATTIRAKRRSARPILSLREYKSGRNGG